MAKKTKARGNKSSRTATTAMAKVETPPATTPATITIVEAAKRLRIGRNQAYEAVHRGEIPHIKIGKRLLVPTAALNRLLGEIA
jgi:excisionase family DNA binding protein